MEGIIQIASVQVMRKMDKKKQYSESEKKVIVYGLELIFFFFLKSFAYLAVGFALGKGMEVAAVMTAFGALRKTSGGKHAKTNLGCFTLTGGILAISVGVPMILQISETTYIAVAVAALLLYLEFAPEDEYYRCAEREKQEQMQKIKSVLLAAFILAIGYVSGEYWRIAALSVVVLQGVTLINKKGVKRDERERI